jgi:hypothetical protein
MSMEEKQMEEIGEELKEVNARGPLVRPLNEVLTNPGIIFDFHPAAENLAFLASYLLGYPLSHVLIYGLPPDLSFWMSNGLYALLVPVISLTTALIVFSVWGEHSPHLTLGSYFRESFAQFLIIVSISLYLGYPVYFASKLGVLPFSKEIEPLFGFLPPQIGIPSADILCYTILALLPLLTSALCFLLFLMVVIPSISVVALLVSMTEASAETALPLLPLLIPLNLTAIFSSGFWFFTWQAGWENILIAVVLLDMLPYWVLFMMRRRGLRNEVEKFGPRRIKAMSQKEIIDQGRQDFKLSHISRIKDDPVALEYVHRLAHECRGDYEEEITRIEVIMALLPFPLLALLAVCLIVVLFLCFPDSVICSMLPTTGAVNTVVVARVFASVVLSIINCSGIQVASLSSGPKVAEFIETSFGDNIREHSLLFALRSYFLAVEQHGNKQEEDVSQFILTKWREGDTLSVPEVRELIKEYYQLKKIQEPIFDSVWYFIFKLEDSGHVMAQGGGVFRRPAGVAN